MTKQYIELGKKIVETGTWVTNERTGKRCLTIINHDLEYDVGAGELPLVTTRKSFWKSAIAEMTGYIRGYDNAADFRKLGTKTWDANANQNDVWLNNPARKGEDDMGYVYGKAARQYPCIDHLGNITYRDTLKEVYTDLKAGIDNRGELINFWNPGVENQGCLRPCMYSHHFSILDGTLYLNSAQRSIDVPLGLNFNMVQCYYLLAIMAQITGLKAGKVYHKLVNCHVYEDQLELFKKQLEREPEKPTAKLLINKNIKSLEDLETWVTMEDFKVVDYVHQEAINYPFSV